MITITKNNEDRSTIARKFIVGDLVKHTLTDDIYRITWIAHGDDKAGIVKKEKRYGAWEGKEVPLVELTLVKPSVHTSRPLKPVNDMTTEELREHVRLLREGRHEALVNRSESSGKSKRKRKSKSKSTNKNKSKTSEPTLDPEIVEALKNLPDKED